MRLFRWAIIMLCAPLAGCATLQGLSSGQIGCPTEEIQISNDDPGFAMRTWRADCQGRVYYCSAYSSGQQGAMQVSCKERAEGAVKPEVAVSKPDAAAKPEPTVKPEAAGPVGGCQYDTQCKGERICKSGRCEDPSPTPK